MEDPAAVTQEQERPGGPLEVDDALVDDIMVLLESGQRGMVLNVLADMYPADIARLLTHIPFDEARRIFRWLPVEKASDMLAELDDAYRAQLLEEAHLPLITRLLDQLETDDAADVLADLPNDVALQVLPTLEDVEDIRELLGYPEDTAGGIMGTEFVDVPQSWTVAQATEAMRQNAEHVDEIYALFVHDADGRLVGTVTLKHLLLSPSGARVGDIMDTDVISVTPEVDQEEVGRIMQRYDIVSLPVVDAQMRMMGRITIDDVVDVIREEAEEDMRLMSGTAEEEPHDSVLRISRGRLPWLLVGMFGAGLSGLVIGRFEDALERAVVLATFIPVVMAMAGNAGIQSSSIVVQGLASGELWHSDLLRRLTKELGVALLNGLILAVVLSGSVMLLFGGDNVVRLAITAGISMLLVIVLATIIGTTVPLLLDRFKIDPALATGPFITTSNDILALAVFFALASLIYL